MSQSVVIVGAGQAGFSAATALRKYGFAGGIRLIGAEPHAPYQRPPLSKAFLLGEVGADRLLLKPESFYRDQGIDLITGTTIAAIDRMSRTVFAAEQSWSYDHLVLATGSRVRRLSASSGDDLAGVHYLRSQEDASAIGSDIVSGRHVLIVGGGYVGLEVAAVARKRGMRVTLIEAGDRILQRVASEGTSQYFRRLHQSQGVQFRERTGLSKFVGRDRVEGAVLSDGTRLSIDSAVVGVGIVPSTDLAERSELTIENGISVDETGRSSDSRIWAVGDCCSFPYRGARVRLESVPHAIDHAEIVARNICGENVAYAARPWFWSDQYDVKLQIAGLNAGFDQVVSRMANENGPASFWYFRGPQLLAVDALNDARSYVIARKLLETGVSPTPEQAGDANVDLKALL